MNGGSEKLDQSGKVSVWALTFILRLVLEPVNDRTLILTLWPLLTTSATLATRPSLRSSEMWTRPSHRFLRADSSMIASLERNKSSRSKRAVLLGTYKPQTLQLNKTSKLHYAGDFSVIDVANRRLLWRGAVDVFVLPSVVVSVLVLSGTR